MGCRSIAERGQETEPVIRMDVCPVTAGCTGNGNSQLLCPDLEYKHEEIQTMSSKAIAVSVLLSAALFLTVPLYGTEGGQKAPVINPTPQILEMGQGGDSLDVSDGVRLVDRSGAFLHDVDFLPDGGRKAVRLNVDFDSGKAVKAGVKSVEGAYLLTVGKKGIDILGYDESGAFYGLQTLRQIVEQNSREGRTVLPYMTVNDWPDLPYRGVVEGFYGTPWDFESRLSLIDFYGRYKMNVYVFGPKDDPYHSSPDWRKPYPEEEARGIAELVDACRRNRVEFVWAIHPGQDIRWDEADYDSLKTKFGMMYDLGVRAFAIFFDDISGTGANPMKQVELLNRLNEEFVKAKGDVAPLIICPTDYNRSWANPTERGSLAIYGRELDPSVKVFWTGDYVCSDLTPETLEWVSDRIRRPALFWWNYPVSDYCRNLILQGPVYGLDRSLGSDMLCGLLSNPMEHAEASKLALYGVADYTWNTGSYNPIANWERGLAVLAGEEAADAYRTFAIHSCDTESGYRRDESWETETFRVGKYTEGQFEALEREFRRIEAVPATMEKCANKALVEELRPWLEEFGKLGARGLRTLGLIKVYRSGSDSAFWSGYVDNLMTAEQKKAYEAHKSGTLKLQPFYENAMDDMVEEFYRRVAGRAPYSYTAVGSFANIGTVSGKLMFDDDSTTFYTSAYAQRTGDWIGADLGIVRNVKEIEILQGRNSVDDVDYFDHTILEVSKDGNLWYPLTDSLSGEYIIRWNGSGVDARYVRLRKLESRKTNWAAVRSFSVNPVKIDALGFEVTAPDIDKAVYVFDNNPYTFYSLEGTLSFGIPETGAERNSYTLLMRLHGPLTVRQYASDGSLLDSVSVKSAYFRFPVMEGAVRVEIEGNADIFEIL